MDGTIFVACGLESRCSSVCPVSLDGHRRLAADSAVPPGLGGKIFRRLKGFAGQIKNTQEKIGMWLAKWRK